MTTADCSHFTVDDDQPYCGQCMDEFYLHTPFTMNGHDYKVWAFYGDDQITGQAFYACRRTDGNGTIYITTSDIDNAAGF